MLFYIYEINITLLKTGEMNDNSKETKIIPNDLVPLDINNYQTEETKFGDQLNLLDNDLQDFELSLDSLSTSLQKTANSLDSKTKIRSRRLVIYTLCLGVALAVVIIFGFGGYVLYSLLHMISILSLALSTVSVILTLVGFLIIANFFINEEIGIGGEKGQLSSHISDLQSIISERSDKANKAIKIASILSGNFHRIIGIRDMLSDFNKFKDELKFSLTRYSLINENVKAKIDNFKYIEIVSDREYKWLEKIANILSEDSLFNNLKVPSEIIELSYLDFKQLSLKELKWKSILDDVTKLSSFCKILICGRLIEFETIEDDENKEKFMLSKLKAIKSGFSLEGVQTETKKLDSLLFKIENSLEVVSNKIEGFHFNGLESLGVPDSKEYITRYYIERVASENKMKSEVAYILFFDQFDNKDLSNFLNDKSNSELEEVFSEMKTIRIIRSSLSNSLLVSITRKVISYNHGLSLLKDVISSKEEVIDLSKTARELLSNYGLEFPDPEIIESKIVDSDDYSHIFNMKPKERLQLYIELLEVMLYSESLNSNIRNRLNHENDKRLMVTSLVVILLNLRGSTLDRESIKEISANNTLVNILYLFQKGSTERSQNKLGELLCDCVLLVQENALNEVDRNLSHKFGNLLSYTGRIPNYNYLLHFDVEANLKRFKEEMSEIKENQILRDVITSILDRAWGVEDIKDMVLGNAISAYLLTKPQKTGTEESGSDKVMTYLNDKNIDEIQIVAKRKYRQDDLKGIPPESLVMFRNAGIAMRIGVIPSELSFEEFSDMFDSIITEYLTEKGQKFPVHLTRISASESSLYLINSDGGGADFEKQGILAKIKEIVTTDKFISLNYQLALYSSLRSRNELTLKDSVNLLLEKDRTLLFEHIAKSEYESLSKICERKSLSVSDFVSKFLKSYELEKISQLIRYIVDSIDKKKKSKIRDSISKQIIGILSYENADEYKMNMFSKELADKIIDFSFALKEFGT